MASSESLVESASFDFEVVDIEVLASVEDLAAAVAFDLDSTLVSTFAADFVSDFTSVLA